MKIFFGVIKLLLVSMILLNPVLLGKYLMADNDLDKDLILPKGTVGENYEYQFKLKDESISSKPLWKEVEGKLPDGIELEKSGKLSGKIMGNVVTQKDYLFLVEASWKDDNGKDRSNKYKCLLIIQNPHIRWSDGEDYRAVIGYELSAAGSEAKKKSYFFDLYLSHGFPFLTSIIRSKDNEVIRHPLQIWGNIRFTSIPRTTDIKLGDFASGAANVYKELKEIKLNEFIHTGEFLAGLDYHLWKLAGGRNRVHTFSLIGSLGVVLPVPKSDTIPVFKLTPEVIKRFDDETFDASKTTHIALVRPSVDNFYLQSYFGIRVKTYFKPESGTSGNFNDIKFKFPGILDFTVGWNKYLYRNLNTKKGIVFRIEGFLPLKVSDNLNIYLFGTVLLKSRKNKPSKPLILEPDITMKYTDTGVQLVTERVVDRDYYRIGLGVDFLGLFRK